MTDLEISKALALAIGWKLTDVIWHENKVEVWWYDLDAWEFEWRTFDYRDWNVIGPIAERYDCFPHKSDALGWFIPHSFWNGYADTPQKAIALAIIGAKK